MLGYAAKTDLATMGPILGNDRVFLFCSNTLNINCRLTGLSASAAERRGLYSATGKGTWPQQKIFHNVFPQNEKISGTYKEKCC